MVNNSISKNIDSKEIDFLRRLGEDAYKCALSEDNLRKVSKAKKTNSLCADEPLIFTSPEGAWREILPDSTLKCTHPWTRSWERQLKINIFHHREICCDRSIYPFLQIPWQISDDGFGVPIYIDHSMGDNGSFGWKEYPIKDIKNDLHKLYFRNYKVDRKLTFEMLSLAESIFSGILPVRVWHETYWWTVGLTINAIHFVGLENLMLMIFDQPDEVHRLMAFLRDEQINMIEWCEREGLLHDNSINDNIGSGGPGHIDGLSDPAKPNGDPVRLSEIWGFAESQETVGISPEMFAEFIFPYQLPILEKFGMNYYGCCEPISKRFDSIKQIPRLRKISVSPWDDIRDCAELYGQNYVLCRKVNPSYVSAGTFFEQAARQEIRETLEAAGHLNLEIILKDTHTVCCDPSRIGRWVKIARDQISKWE